MILTEADSFYNCAMFGILGTFQGYINARALRGRVGWWLLIFLLLVVVGCCLISSHAQRRKKYLDILTAAKIQLVSRKSNDVIVPFPI